MRLTHRLEGLGSAMALVFILASTSAQAQLSNAELLERLDAMQQQIDELKQQVARTQGQAEETDAKVEAVAEVIESAPAPVAETLKTVLGGYGELHYNNLSAEDPSRDLAQIDFHRFVLFVGHDFNDKTRFYSELEVEHAFVSDSGGNTPGAVELEQAYVEFDLNPGMFAGAGIFLVPVGMINQTHEPTTFYGVERNDVENIIIPTTWREAGGMLNGRMGPDWDWLVAASSGLNITTTGNNAFRVRSGRQNVANALASDGAITGRLRYMGIAGLIAGVTVQYQFDPSQVANDGLDDGTLMEAHIAYRNGPFGLRALYARWDFSGDAVEAAGADKQTGWYIEPSYRINNKLGFYTRFEDIEAARKQDNFNQWELGLNWWPSPNVVFKFDYRDRSHDLDDQRGRDFTGFDIGMGYSF